MLVNGKSGENGLLSCHLSGEQVPGLSQYFTLQHGGCEQHASAGDADHAWPGQHSQQHLCIC